jgi:Ca2+-binding RTX toxin-like protein
VRSRLATPVATLARRNGRLAIRALTTIAALLLFCAGVAVAKTSHAGWPKRTGILWINRTDQSATKSGTSRSDELLGGHGSDTIYGRGAKDVIWGDYKPGGQPAGQVDRLYGNADRDFIYASHGRNIIYAGPGNDYVKAHFGRGFIDCGSGSDTLYISHRARRGYRVRNCNRISYRSLGR